MLDRATAYGLEFLFPARDETIGRSLADHGEFARPESDFLIEMAAEDRGTFLDVGANIGSICLPFAAARPGWRVIAIEAHAGLAGLLAENGRNNNLANVEVVRAAAGEASRIVDFPQAPLDAAGNFGSIGFQSYNAPLAKTLMVALDEIPAQDVRLVKVDVEGYEPQVLDGAKRLLNDVRPVWLVEAAISFPEASASVIETFLSAGYAVHWFYAPFVTGKPLNGKPAADPARGDANIVALPPGFANPWSLPPVRSPTDVRPGETGAYPYLRRYGY